MDDIFREMMERSIRDTICLVEIINNEEDVQLGNEFIVNGAMRLYDHRVRQQMMKWEQRKEQENFPDNHRGTQ